MKLFSSLFGNASPPTVPNPTSPDAQLLPPLAHYLAQAIRGSGCASGLVGFGTVGGEALPNKDLNSFMMSTPAAPG